MVTAADAALAKIHGACIRYVVRLRRPRSNQGFLDFTSKNCFMRDLCRRFDNALWRFNAMLHTRPLPPTCDFTRFLGYATYQKEFSCSIHCFKQMCAVGVPVNKHTACIAIKCYSRLRQTQHAFTVLGCSLKHGAVPDRTWTGTYNTLIKGFILEDKTHEAERLFKKLIQNRLEPNLVIYNSMITGLCKVGDTFTAAGLVRLMDGRGCKPNLDTYNIVIDALCNDLMVDEAIRLFKGMAFHSVPPDVVTYNSLISALCKLGRWDEVSGMMKQMEAQRISPDTKTLNAIVDALCKRGSIEEAEAVIDMMYDNFGIHVDTVTVNSIIKGYCFRGEVTKARATYDLLGYRCGVPRNVDAYNIMLDGYVRNSKPLEADRLEFDLRNYAKLKPNNVARNILALDDMLSAIRILRHEEEQSEVEFSMDHPYVFILRMWPNSKLGVTYEDALAFFRFMDGNGSKLNSHTGVYNTVIDGALKCGRFDTARRLFHDLTLKGLQPDVRTYYLMITGYTQRGLHKDATKLLFELEKSFRCPLKVKEAIQGYRNNNGSFDFDDVLTVLLEELPMHPTLRVGPDNTTYQELFGICVNHWVLYPKHVKC